MSTAERSAWIATSANAFALLGVGGSVFAWGDAAQGGDCDASTAELTSGVTAVTPNNASNATAYAALKSDGAVVTWGEAGSLHSVSPQLTSGVASIVANGRLLPPFREAFWKHAFQHKILDGGEKGAVLRATLWKHRARLLLPAAQRS